ncbi:stress activated MAP kinase interacting protein Sin1 [Microthyrium microscopicum]|uniref:Stress activated MAP kinase interacting protein Sin1 n=1 Tax=Microthyrium microscopicum TaxID=703497 RepID=A0A6A6UV90_9PEZI|nr:stress activated MAP kinase interacting protein Sin1 [Microthyrium microscopicum]
MSLLQDEEFVIYQLRTSYLSHIKDGVGERLINVNSSVLNNPAFRASGWQHPASEIKRTYSPPIPTAVTAEYFQAPRVASLPGGAFGDDEDEIGMVTGGGSNETVGPAVNAKRRRRKEQMEQDDSSDLSEDSDEDTEARPVQTIKFAKMPLRTRAGSSPTQSTPLGDGPALLVTSPSRPSEMSQLRRGSVGAVEGMRPRRDTTTTTASSELSSENEVDSSFFQRKPVSSRKARISQLLTDRIQEDEREGNSDDDPGAESDTTLSSVLEGSADSGSILGGTNELGVSLSGKLPGIPQASTPQRGSPRKLRPQPAALQALPPPRPISMIAPVSLLSQALNAKTKAPEVPFTRFATLSGKADTSPLYIKIYAASSKAPDKPFEIMLRRAGESGVTTVADAIGFALYRYNEEAREPKITGDKANVNRWNFRMVEDGEVEYDFPALGRTRAISDFTSNNNRGARGRSREKPWDEFALVEASEGEFKANETATPKYGEEASPALESVAENAPPPVPSTPAPPPPADSPSPSITPFRNPITGPSFASSVFRKDGQPLDAPVPNVARAIPRTGLSKNLNIRFTDENLLTRTTLIEVTTDTYIAEVFDQVCKRLNLDKALYVIKVSNSNTIVPHDRTVEALGDRSDLDLHRRRFVGDGSFGLSNSPGSTSPNAPLLIVPSGSAGTPKKGSKKTTGFGSIPPSQRHDASSILFSGALGMGMGAFKRYHVVRKQPMSFSSSSNRIITLDSEFMHIMPSEGPKAMWETQGKTTTIPFSSVVGCKVSRKHARMFRVTVFKERESKRYDFEASSPEESMEIVEEIRKGMDSSKPERLLEFGM